MNYRCTELPSGGVCSFSFSSILIFPPVDHICLWWQGQWASEIDNCKYSHHQISSHEFRVLHQHVKLSLKRLCSSLAATDHLHHSFISSACSCFTAESCLHYHCSKVCFLWWRRLCEDKIRFPQCEVRRSINLKWFHIIILLQQGSEEREITHHNSGWVLGPAAWNFANQTKLITVFK